MSTPPLFLVDELPAGDHTVLGGQEGRHASTVRRLRDGEPLVLSDGRGGIAEGVVDGVPEKTGTLGVRVLSRTVVPTPRPRVVVAQALVKGERGELAVELATEAGADAVVPWRASRCVARWDEGPRGAKALARWRSSVREAAKQARRAWVPEVADPVSTTELAKLVADGAQGLVLEGSANTPLTDVPLPDQGDLLLVVGPEGGITDQELDTLTNAGAQAVRLGSTVLRASTAAAVALGALGALTPRWT